MKKTGFIFILAVTFFLIVRFVTTVDGETVNQFLKDYKIIASKPDIYYSYDQISKTHPWGLIAKKDGVYFMTDPDGNKLNERGFQKIGSFNDYGLAEVENSEGMVGLINTAGELVADTAYYDINPFGEDELAIVEVLIPYNSSGTGDNQQVSYKGREGLISTSGELVVEPEYFNITYREDVALYHIDYYYYGEKLGSRNSLFSATDGWLENSTYDSIGKFKDGVAVVTKDGMDGLINTKAETIIPPIYNNVFEASEGLLRVDNIEDQSAFFDIEGNVVIPFRDYRVPTPFKYGVSIVLSPDSNFSRRKAALMDATGEMLTDYIFDDFEPFRHYEDIDRVLTMAGPHNSRFNGLINTAGHYIVEPKYSDIEYDKAGYFRTVTYVFSEERNTPTKKFYYFTDLEGNEYVELGFSNPNGDKPDSIGKLGILDNSRAIVSDSIYDDVRPELDSMILVKQGPYWGVVNNLNEPLLPIEYQAIELITSSFALAKRNDQWGIVDPQDGSLILPIVYDELEYLSLNQINAKKDNQWSIIDIQ